MQDFVKKNAKKCVKVLNKEAQMLQPSEKELFKLALEHLYEKQGIKLIAIAEKIDVPASKLINIRRGASSGNAKLLNKLYSAFPDLKIAIEGDEKEEEELKKRNEELREILKEKEKLIQHYKDLADRLEKMIEAHEKGENEEPIIKIKHVKEETG